MKIFLNKKIFFPPIILFLLLCSLLILSWFKEGLLYGGGDVGLPTFNPQRILDISKYIWWESAAPGYPLPYGVISVPLQFYLSFFQKIGFTPVFLQALLFFILLFLTGFGSYILILSILGRNLYKVAILTALFYMFNPYMMISIWHRFIHSSMFLVALLPFIVLFWQKWVKWGNFKYLFLFLLVNFLGVSIYGTIAFVFTIWFLLFILTFFESIIPWQGRVYFLKMAVKFITGLFFWLAINSWWLVVTYTVSPNIFASQHSNEESLTTLINISRQAILPYSLQMINPFYLFMQQDFGSFYQNFLVRIIPWLLVSVILLGLVSGLKKIESVKWSLVFIIILFLAKGASAPFGQIFIYGFEHFFPLGVLRNPFEKIGILLPFVGAILFAQGFLTISNLSVKNPTKNFLSIFYVFILLVIIIFHWPMFNPGIFGKIDKPAFVKVPESYQEMDRWIINDLAKNQSKSLGKILHLPLTRGEGITYNWEYGYSGLEPSSLFFTSLPSISKGFNIKRIDDSLTALSLIFHKPYSGNTQKILKILQDFNVSYIILHKDIAWLGGELYSPIETEEILNNLPFLEHTQNFGDLSIYKLSDQYFEPKIMFTNNIQLVYPSDEGFIWPYILGNDQTMITPLDQKVDQKLFDIASQIIIFPKDSSIYPKKSFVLAVLNKILTDQSAAKLLTSEFERVKLTLLQNGEIQAEELNNKLISVTEKVLTILQTQVESGVIQKSQIESYENELNDIFSSNLRESRLLLYINEKDMSLVFQIHLNALGILSEKGDYQAKLELNKIQSFLNDKLISENFLSQYPLSLDDQEFSDTQQVFKFKIPQQTKYEILLTNTKDKLFYKDNLEKFMLSINGNSQEFKTVDEGKFLSLGNYDFGSDLLEIGYNTLSSSNLLLPFEKLVKVGNIELVDDLIKIEPQGQFGYIESEIPNVGGGDIIRVSFEALAQNTNGFYFQLAQDTDSINKEGQRVNKVNEFINLNTNNWQSFTFTLSPLNITTQQASVRLVVVNNAQMPQSSILIKNFKIEKVLNSAIVLRALLNKPIDFNSGGKLLNFERKSPVLYQGKLRIDKPIFLIFSETFHPDWKLKLIGGKNVYIPPKHLMANLYGNAYFIEKTGEYDFILEFESQKYVKYGIYLAVTCLFFLGSFTLWKQYKK